jgi:rhodanese-related sulfurtransferase
MVERTKKVEFLANVAIIGLAILLGLVLIKRSFFSSSESSQPDKGIKTGATFQLQDVDWARNRQTLIVVLNQGCQLCSENAPFYQRLARELVGKDDVEIIAVMPGSVSESEEYLRGIGVSVDLVRQAPLETVGVTGTPTLILVNHEGIVTGVWIGELTASQESMLIARINPRSEPEKNSGTKETAIIDERELKHRIDTKQPVIVLDLNDRPAYAAAHIPGARNLPLDELEVRAPNELPHSDLLVLYCSCRQNDASLKAREMLVKKGFLNVVVLNGGLNGWKQAGLPLVSQ